MGNFRGRKLSQTGKNEDFAKKTFMEQSNPICMGVGIDIYSACVCVPCPKKFAKKTFVALHKSVKFAKVFSLESFLLYYGIIS